MKGVRGNGEDFERGGGFVGVVRDDAKETVDTADEGTAPIDIVRRGLHDSCSRSKDRSFAKGCT